MEKKEESLDGIADISGVSSNMGVTSLIHYGHSVNTDFLAHQKTFDSQGEGMTETFRVSPYLQNCQGRQLGKILKTPLGGKGPSPLMFPFPLNPSLSLL